MFRTLQKILKTALGHLPTSVARRVSRIVTPSYTVGAVAVLVREPGQVLLLRQRHLRGWSLPGGHSHRGEMPRSALLRELQEELGVAVTVPERSDAVVVDPRDRRVDFVWVLRGVTDFAIGDDTEVLSCEWRPYEESEATFPARAALDAVRCLADRK